MTNRKGKTVTTSYSDAEAFRVVEQAVREGRLDGFAVDLVTKGSKYGLSDEQFWWVHRLANPEPMVEQPAQNVLHAFKQAAANGVKARNLKLLYQTDDGTVQLAMAGAKSKYQGDIWVTDGGTYPDNKLYGRIDGAHGIFRGRDVPQHVAKLITQLNDGKAKMPW